MGVNIEKRKLVKQKYYRKLKLLNETIWEKKVNKNKIDGWLSNFKEEEKQEALYLLTQFIYFNEFSVEKLLEALYRDIFKYKIIADIRRNNDNTTDAKIIEPHYRQQLKQSRFVSLGNPSESSATLMGLMRKINSLPNDLFISEDKIAPELGKINNFVFIDDLCGSGSQAIDYSTNSLPKIRRLFPDAKIWYLMLIATKEGKHRIQNMADFDYVDSIHELDNSYKCFNEGSRVFTNKDEDIDILKIKNFCGEYGKNLMESLLKKNDSKIDPIELEESCESWKYGFNNGQLLLGFHHNTPDNTLPIFWYNEKESDWYPIFKRFNKVYGI
ncbi:hypothetical protein SAMN04487764_2979 [Gillisia sp. Hel1_33_143]|uniref:phosphoribosyltransferase-like protein n=1 Tax=Gillisia sp. Hel1_33_143 TaxID=1336796 RepID=UPI00087B2510|nr:hypothetical protein [Gillisia sp. Hel1_33_143]SDS75589.1 hypothetical protein SAMN04487764_2979 [Gillisia sp. Hel1_33_143]